MEIGLMSKLKNYSLDHASDQTAITEVKAECRKKKEDR
jgi:hypothetical protein